MDFVQRVSGRIIETSTSVFSREKKGDTHSVTRKALGRTASMGSLYDVRADRFTGKSLFDQQVPVSLLEVTDVPETRIEYAFKDTYEEKFKKLNVELQLSASVMAGLLKLDGCGTYFSDHKASSKTVKCSLIYQLKTVVERLNVQHKDVKGLVLPEALNNDEATHVVVGILWGANVIASVESRDISDNDQQRVEGILEAHLRKIGRQIGGDWSVEFDGGEQKFANELELRLVGDIVPDELPLSVEDLLKVMRQVPKYVRRSNQGKGKQLEYVLLPLTSIANSFKFEARVHRVIKELDEWTINRVEQEFDELLRSQRRFHDFFQQVDNCRESLLEGLVKDVEHERNQIRITETEFRKAISSTLIEVRSGQADPWVLEQVLEKHQMNPRSADGISTYLHRNANLRAKVSLISSLKSRGVLFLPRDSSMQELLLNYSNATVYALHMADRFAETPLWEANYRLFYQLLDQHKEEVADNLVYFVLLNVDMHVRDCRNRAVIVQYYKNELVSHDFYADNKAKFTRNLIKQSELIYPSEGTPNFSEELTIACPSRSCKNEPRSWICSECEQEARYGYNEKVYCQCGEAAIQACSFKCSDPFHGNDFVPFNTVRSVLPNLDLPVEINLLLMGETGVGKSTFINAFVNYISYSTFDEAEREEVQTLIYSKFSLADDNLQMRTIEIGKEDGNEKMTVGESCTQDCRVYRFPAGNKVLRIIDTPGIGDSRGIEQDKKNFDKILNVISNFTHLNGIAILNKPNNARLNVYLRFCTTELLTHLHKDAAKNIAFIFTSSRGTFYRLGDTGPILKQALDGVKDSSGIDIPLNKQTMYFFDNEAFKFLVALKQGVEFSDDEREQFSKSWEKSVKESDRLLKYFEMSKPHKVKDTVTLNNARKILNELSKPLVDIVQNIANNIKVMKDKKKEIDMDCASIMDLEKSLEVYITELNPVTLEKPMTVCTSPGCIKVVGDKFDYTTECHKSCYLEGVQQNIYNDVALRTCAAFDRASGKCIHCECSWQMHMHITYKNELVRKKAMDKHIKEQIDAKISRNKKKEHIIEGLEQRIAGEREEQATIIKTGAELAHFLQANAITPYNDATADYLDLAIQEETATSGVSGDKTGIERMKVLKKEYLQETEMFTQALGKGSNTNNLSVEEVHTKVESLYSLPLNGAALRKQVMAIQKGDQASAKYQETPYKPKKKSEWWRKHWR